MLVLPISKHAMFHKAIMLEADLREVRSYLKHAVQTSERPVFKVKTWCSNVGTYEYWFESCIVYGYIRQRYCFCFCRRYGCEYG